VVQFVQRGYGNLRSQSKGHSCTPETYRRSAQLSRHISLLCPLTNVLAEEAPEPESSNVPKKKNQSGRQSCNPADTKGKQPQRDDDDDGMDGSSSPGGQPSPSTSTSQSGPSHSNSPDGSTDSNGASGGPSGTTASFAAYGGKYEVDEDLLNFLLEDAIAWNPKPIAAPPSSGADLLALPRYDIPPMLTTHYPLDDLAIGGLPLAVGA
jgi:hypothetical protein